MFGRQDDPEAQTRKAVADEVAEVKERRKRLVERADYDKEKRENTDLAPSPSAQTLALEKEVRQKLAQRDEIYRSLPKDHPDKVPYSQGRDKELVQTMRRLGEAQLDELIDSFQHAKDPAEKQVWRTCRNSIFWSGMLTLVGVPAAFLVRHVWRSAQVAQHGVPLWRRILPPLILTPALFVPATSMATSYCERQILALPEHSEPRRRLVRMMKEEQEIIEQMVASPAILGDVNQNDRAKAMLATMREVKQNPEAWTEDRLRAEVDKKLSNVRPGLEDWARDASLADRSAPGGGGAPFAGSDDLTARRPRPPSRPASTV